MSARRRSNSDGRPEGARGSGARRRGGGRRVGSIRRRALLLLAVLTIPAGLLVSVRRTADGTRLTEQLEELRRETTLLEEALVDEVVRVDSLTSRARIGRVAEELGLRQAEEHEVVILGDVAGIEPDGEGP